jgi:hypothetical protein
VRPKRRWINRRRRRKAAAAYTLATNRTNVAIRAVSSGSMQLETLYQRQLKPGGCSQTRASLAKTRAFG